MATTRQPRPGDYFLSRIPGVGGWFIALGQFLCGDPSRFTHAGIVLDDNTVMEARPSRAGYRLLSSLDEPLFFSRLDLTDEQRALIVAHARGMEGRRYSYVTYLAIGLARLGVRPGWLRRYVERSGRIICSAAVDDVYRRSGVHLFTDGRWVHEVTPGDLHYVGE